MEKRPVDLPLDELIAMADDVLARSGHVWLKFTCQHCGSRQMIDEPDTFYIFASCEECGQTTSLGDVGGGLMVILPLS